MELLITELIRKEPLLKGRGFFYALFPGDRRLGGEGVRDEGVRSEGFIWEPLRNYTT